MRAQKLGLCSGNWNHGVRGCLLGAGVREETVDASNVPGGREERNTLTLLLSLPSSLPSLPAIGPAGLHARGQRSLGNVVSYTTERRAAEQIWAKRGTSSQRTLRRIDYFNV